MSNAKVECSICFEDSELHELAPVASDLLCQQCFEGNDGPKQRLDNAMRGHGQYYPAVWPLSDGTATVDIDPSKYPSYYDKQWCERYRARADEVALPLADRLYCKHRLLKGSENVRSRPLTPAQIANVDSVNREQCNTFLGARTTPSITECKCTGRTCAACSFPLYQKDMTGHICQAFTGTDDTFEIPGTWKLSRDYQYCPEQKCCRMFILAEACNHCQCRKCGGNASLTTHFCYVCGKPAHLGEGHWIDIAYVGDENHCPQYGQHRQRTLPPVLGVAIAGPVNANVIGNPNANADPNAEIPQEHFVNGVVPFLADARRVNFDFTRHRANPFQEVGLRMVMLVANPQLANLLEQVRTVYHRIRAEQLQLLRANRDPWCFEYLEALVGLVNAMEVLFSHRIDEGPHQLDEDVNVLEDGYWGVVMACAELLARLERVPQAVRARDPVIATAIDEHQTMYQHYVGRMEPLIRQLFAALPGVQGVWQGADQA